MAPGPIDRVDEVISVLGRASIQYLGFSINVFNVIQEDLENILRARASGKRVLTSPFKLLKSNHLDIVLSFAVYNTDLPPDTTPEQRIGATVG